MSQAVLDYVRTLSARDTKTLTQRALKLTEETGELAKVVMPYDNVPTTLHRVVTKAKIAEEAVDVMLVALSILHQLEYDDNEIDSLMFIKAEKWDKLLAREDKLGDRSKVPHEIHVTVNLGDYTVEYFKQACADIGVKPIVLDLPIEGGTMVDVMTSSHFFGSTAASIEKANLIGYELKQQYGLHVVRTKVETVPWHPHAPQTYLDQIQPGCYFEAHVGVLMDSNDAVHTLTRLKDVADRVDAHMSRNVFKRYDGGTYVQMLTLRDFTSADTFDINLDYLLKTLTSYGYHYEKVIKEYAVYDTKVDHDRAWIGNEQL